VKDGADWELVQGCRRGDRKACEQLVLQYQKPVYNVALRLLRNVEDAKDVVQTAFMKAFEHLAQYDPRFKFYSWIYRIAVNEALDTLGSRTGRQEELPPETADEAAGPDRLLEGQQSMHAIEGALAGIKPEMRAVIVLRHFSQLSYHDMSDVLQLPEKTVKSRLHEARLQLRDALIAQGAFPHA
jgi:RNA polymerase sigma-70 factor, ECF subfamily